MPAQMPTYTPVVNAFAWLELYRGRTISPHLAESTQYNEAAPRGQKQMRPITETMGTPNITSSKKQSEQRAPLFAFRVHVIQLLLNRNYGRALLN